MTNAFASAAKNTANMTSTENGHAATITTGSSVLDLYGVVGALRNEDFGMRVRPLFDKAIADDKLLAAKTMFYARDARGGTGERDLFRKLISYAATKYPEMVRPNIALIPFYGRWDDMYALIDTPLETDMWRIVAKQLDEDLTNLRNDKPVSLMAKWLKSCNSSSKETQALGRMTAKKLGYSEKDYRKLLSKLRNAEHIVERKMSAKQWLDIPYDKLPSRAAMLYRDAFRRHDEDGYANYLANVKKGIAKINAKAVTPYDLVHAYANGRILSHIDEDETIEALWANLPDYLNTDENIMCMVDVSGSMQGKPVEVAAGLGMYFAQKNKGDFHNLFMTFESDPSFVSLDDNASFAQNLVRTFSAPWDGSTNLNKACEALLQFAKDHHVPDKDMPTRLIIISDMEIDMATSSYDYSTWGISRYSQGHNDILHADELKAMYAEAGYTMPQVIYWNVNSRHNHFQTKSDIPGTMLASGESPAVFEALLAIQDMEETPLSAMLEVLNGERYAPITVDA